MEDKNLLSEFCPNYEMLGTGDQFEKLVAQLAEWLTLMELCEDLLNRLVDYKIVQIENAEQLHR